MISLKSFTQLVVSCVVPRDRHVELVLYPSFPTTHGTPIGGRLRTTLASDGTVACGAAVPSTWRKDGVSEGMLSSMLFVGY